MFAIVRMAFGCMFDVGSSMLASFLPHLLCSFLRVLRIPVRGRFILPLEVAGDSGRYFRMRLAFRNGMPSSCSLLAALMSVCSGALQKTWCIYLSWFCLYGNVYNALAVCGIGWLFRRWRSRLLIVLLLLLGFLFGLSGNLQSCVVGSRSPTKTNFLL